MSFSRDFMVACIGVLVNVIGVGVNAYDCWSRRRQAATSSAVTASPAGGNSGHSTEHPELPLIIAGTSDLPHHGSMKRQSCSTVCWQSRASAASAVVKTDVINNATGVELALEEGNAGLYYGECQPRDHNHVIEIDTNYRNMIP